MKTDEFGDHVAERRDRVRFEVGNAHVDVYEKDGKVYIYASNGLVVRPTAANCVTLEVDGT